MALSDQTDKMLEPKKDETFFDKYVAGEKTKGMFNPSARNVVDFGSDFIPGVSETKDIISLGTNVNKGEYKSAGIDLASLILGAVPVVGDLARRGFKTLTKNISKSEDVVSKQADEVGESLQKVYGNIKPPKKTTKAYKLFKADKRGNLYPLFVKMQGNKPLELNKWTKAEAGEINPKTGKVKSSLGDLAYRPGFHGGDLPIATHIGGKKGKVTKPNYRKDNQVWAEVEFGDDVDWQSVANSRALKNKDGSISVKTAHITDQVPEGGVYRYKTNPNMTGNWLIGGELKINRILPDKEVKSINDRAGVADLPRLKDLQLAEGGTVMKKQMEMFEGGDTSIDTSKLQSSVKEKKDNRKIQFDNMTKLLTSGKVKDLSIEEKDNFLKLYKMLKQHHSFNDGGLLDEGGMIDEVSGNDVPSGSTREEVRDDIPAQLSEGEFVFPADVVRYIGLSKLMELRQEAKQGLKQMEAMGQMGNSDEATMPDDLPFDETDLDMEDELEYNRGGVIEAQQGTYVAPTVPTGSQPLGTGPMGNPVGVPQQTTGGVSNVARGTPYTPDVSKMYGAGATPYAPVSYNQLLGPSATGAPTTETVRYFNAATGQSRMIPHLVNADGTRGATLYPVPEGFVIQEEAPKEEAKKTQVQSTKVAPVDTGDDSGDQEQRDRDEAMYGPGGGRISLGGKIDVEKTNRLGGPVRGSSLTKGATTFGIGYTVPGSIPGIYGALANVISIGSKGVPEGGTGKFTLDGVTLTKSAEVTNAIIKDPMGSEAKSLIEQHTNARKSLQDLKQSNPNLSNRQARAIVDAVVQADKIVGDDQSVTFSIENIDNRVRDAYIDAVEDASKNDDGSFNVNSYNSLPSTVQEVYNESVTQKEDEQQQYGGYTPSSLSSLSPNNDDNNQSNNDSMDAAAAGGGDSFGLFKQGGLASKKKPKVKKMKRGGLASR